MVAPTAKKAFLGGFGNKDYSGFDRDMWPKRTGDAHRKDALSLKSHRTKAEKSKTESELGCNIIRTSILQCT